MQSSKVVEAVLTALMGILIDELRREQGVSLFILKTISTPSEKIRCTSKGLHPAHRRKRSFVKLKMLAMALVWP